MRTKSFCLFDGGFSTPCVRFWCSCVAGSRVHSYGVGCSVEMCASYVHSGLFKAHRITALQPEGRHRARPITALKAGSPPFSLKGSRYIIGMTVLIIIAVEPKICQEREGESPPLWITEIINRVIPGLSTEYSPVNKNCPQPVNCVESDLFSLS